MHLDDVLARTARHTARKKAVPIGLLGNAAALLPELVRRSRAALIRPDRATQADLTQHAALHLAAAQSCAVHVQAMLDFQALGVPTVDYGNNIRQVAF